MSKARPHLITTEESKSLPVLIIDKKGIVGTALADKLKEQFLVVLVSGRELNLHNNIVHVPYLKKIPVIPDNKYSHIFVFYNGEKEILEMLSTFIKKANATGARVLFLTTLLHSNAQLFKYLENHLFHPMKIILYGEVFDKKIQSPNMVNLFIYQIRKNNQIIIPNEGLGKLYPVALDDLLIVIIAASFAQEIKGGTLFVFPRHPFTEITVARIFQRVNSDIKIDFSRRRSRSFDYHIPEVGEFAFRNYNLEEGIKKINLSSDQEQALREKEVSLPKRKINLNARFLLITVLAFLIVPVLFVLLSAGAGTLLISQSVREAEQGHFQTASSLGAYASASYGGSEAVTQIYFPADILLKNQKEKFLANMKSLRQVSDIEADVFHSMNEFFNIYNSAPGATKSDFVKTAANVKNNLLKLEEMRAQGQLPAIITTKLGQLSFETNILENTIDSYSQILGFDGKRKYLLLFQNNMELRPGGGFIGSYATVDVERGRVGKLDIHDVYDADGKLKTHIEPPFALKRYGGVTHWFLRDSNFDVDTVSNAAAAATILKQETGEDIDGAISIDTNFIKNLLSAIGPVEVPDYKETVSADNFYLLTQKHAEDNFFAGSTQKKDFLRSLMESILLKLSEQKKVSVIDLLMQIEKSIKEKHVFFVFEDPAIQEAFTVNNLSARVIDARRADESILNDYFGVIDANIGANKSNYYLKREISQNVTIGSNGAVSNTATIIYTNTSSKTDKFGGDYKNYVRFVLPTGADLKSVNIDGIDNGIISAITNPTQYQAVFFAPPSEVEIESSQIESKEVAGFFLTVPVESTKKVTIAYTIPQVANVGLAAFDYDLRLFKQPGTDMDPYSLTLNYPTKFKPIELGPDAQDLGGKVTYETKLNEDKDIKIQFSQK